MEPLDLNPIARKRSGITVDSESVTLHLDDRNVTILLQDVIRRACRPGDDHDYKEVLLWLVFWQLLSVNQRLDKLDQAVDSAEVKQAQLTQNFTPDKLAGLITGMFDMVKETTKDGSPPQLNQKSIAKMLGG